MSEPQQESGTRLGQGVQVTGKQNKRLRQTVFDMVISMAVVLAAVAVVMILVWRPQPDPIKLVDPQPQLSLAAAQAEFEVVAPEGLSKQWRPTSARWTVTNESEGAPVLHVGYVTPGEQYAQLSEFAFDGTKDPAMSKLVREQAQGLRPDDVRSVDGDQWLAAEFDGERMIAHLDNGRMIVVSGTADWTELETLATSLQPVSEPAAS